MARGETTLPTTGFTRLSLRIKVLLLAVVPLVILAGVIMLASMQLEREANAQRAVLEQSLLATKEKELRLLLDLAFAAIKPIMDDISLNTEQQQEAVKRLFNKELFFGEDGYFYVYDRQGVNLAHPVMPDFVGHNKLDLQDSAGTYVVRELLSQAQQGQGVVAYRWTRPSTGQEEYKLGHARLLAPWQWMIGTGLYDVNAEVDTHLKPVSRSIRQTFDYLLLLLGAAVLSLVVLAFWVNWQDSRWAERHLQQLVHNFVQLQVEERRGFARELHDGINQLLVAVRFRIELAQQQMRKGNAAYHESLGVALSTLDTTIKEVRQISHGLRPALLDEMGLAVALEHLVAQFQERTAVNVVRHWVIELQTLPEDVAIMLYRVVQEALSNIERHAHASQVQIEVRQTAQALQLVLTDNGVGFLPEQPTPARGIGLLHMRERVELLGGVLRLESAPGQGTHIQAQLPLGTVAKE